MRTSSSTPSCRLPHSHTLRHTLPLPRKRVSCHSLARHSLPHQLSLPPSLPHSLPPSHPACLTPCTSRRCTRARPCTAGCSCQVGWAPPPCASPSGGPHAQRRRPPPPRCPPRWPLRQVGGRGRPPGGPRGSRARPRRRRGRDTAGQSPRADLGGRRRGVGEGGGEGEMGVAEKGASLK